MYGTYRIAHEYHNLYIVFILSQNTFKLLYMYKKVCTKNANENNSTATLVMTVSNQKDALSTETSVTSIQVPVSKNQPLQCISIPTKH